MSKMLVLISALALLSLSESTFAQGGTCEARCSARWEKAQGSVAPLRSSKVSFVGICLGNCKVTREKRNEQLDLWLSLPTHRCVSKHA